MTHYKMLYQPVEGKTYSLFGDTESTAGYFALISTLAEAILTQMSIGEALSCTKKYSSGKRFLPQISHQLNRYTKNTANHLQSLSILKKLRDKRLATSEEQHHLYMLEIELTNRLNQRSFLEADRKISLQPYCLQDFNVECKSSKADFDYQCQHCSGSCYQHHASRVLQNRGIEAYIWRGGSIRKVAKETYLKRHSLGILGIACIPELAMGMRRCTKYKIPVIGIPLNANRCIRWIGSFHPNSIDLEELEKLVGR